MDAQETDRLYELKETEEHVRVRILAKHNILVINDILARYSS